MVSCSQQAIKGHGQIVTSLNEIPSQAVYTSSQKADTSWDTILPRCLDLRRMVSESRSWKTTPSTSGYYLTEVYRISYKVRTLSSHSCIFATVGHFARHAFSRTRLGSLFDLTNVCPWYWTSSGKQFFMRSAWTAASKLIRVKTTGEVAYMHRHLASHKISHRHVWGDFHT